MSARRVLMVTQQGRTSPLELDGKTTVVIGRSSSCDVFVDEGSVSRRHAVVHVHPDRLEIEDLGSQNGTLLLDVVRTGDGVETARGNGTRLAAHERALLSENTLALIGTAQLMLSSSHQVVADEAPEELRARAEEAERRRVLAALQECAGNQTRAARHLGLTRRALVRRLEKFNVPRPRR